MDLEVELNALPGDVLRSIALEMPLDRLDRLCKTNKNMDRQVCLYDDFWRRRFIYDFGDPHIFDDLEGRTWRQKYKIRHSMNRVWEIGFGIGVRPPIIQGKRVYAKQVYSPLPGLLITLNIDDTFDIYSADNPVVHYDIRASKILLITMPIIGVLTTDGRLIFGILSYGSAGVVVSGITDIIDIYRHTAAQTDDLVMRDSDNNLKHLLVEYEPGMRSVLVNTGMKVKDYSGGHDVIAVVDMDNDVWYTTDINLKLKEAKWTKIPNIKAKAVTAGLGIIITDLDDNLWGYGDNRYGNLGIGDVHYAEVPTRIPITGRKVYMDVAKTIVIDMDHNVWYMGTEIDRHGYIEALFDEDEIDLIDEPMKVPNFKGLSAEIDAEYLYLVGNYYQ